jgi:uncharacterized protein (DUF1499 family)
MGLFTWLTRNWADTGEAGSGLNPVDLPLPPAEALARSEDVINSLPRFRVESVDAAAGVIRATRTTRLFRFVDDVTLSLEPTSTGTRVHARSQARLGKGDFGQNRRNLVALLSALRAAAS